jgi:hypothetical protein
MIPRQCLIGARRCLPVDFFVSDLNTGRPLYDRIQRYLTCATRIVNAHSRFHNIFVIVVWTIITTLRVAMSSVPAQMTARPIPCGASIRRR